MKLIARISALKYITIIFFVFVVSLIPNLVKANTYLDKVVSGTWFVYGFGMYQPTDRIVTPDNGKPQLYYKAKLFYGVGIGKDNLRIDYTSYFDKPRIAFSVDFLKNSIVVPYASILYVTGLGLKDDSGVTRNLVRQFDMSIGFSIEPVRFLSVYAEYLLKDSSFFTGVRIKIPYTF